jgi:hypothetical protein
METLLERATAAGFEVSNNPVETPELVEALLDLALEHNICAAGFRGWLIGNELNFTEEFGSVEDGIEYHFGDFILDEYPNFGFSFEDANDGVIIGLTYWDL